MNKTEISEQLKVFLESEFPNQALDLTETTSLIEEWFIDSIGIVETVLFIEDNFGVEVSRADINGTNFQNIATLAEFVEQYLGAASR